MPLGMSKLSMSDFLTDVFNTYKKKGRNLCSFMTEYLPLQNKKSPSRFNES